MTHYTEFLNELTEVKTNFKDEYVKICIDYYDLNNIMRTGYMSIDIQNHADDIIKNNPDINFKDGLIPIRSHDLYAKGGLINIGYKASKEMDIRYDGATYIDLDELYAKLYVIWYNSRILNNKTYNIPISSLFIMLCVGVYEFDDYHNLAKEFAMNDFKSQRIKDIQACYKASGDIKAIHLINIIIRSKSYVIKEKLKHITYHYKPGRFNGNIKKVLKKPSSKALKHNEGMQEACSIVALLVSNTYKYGDVIKECTKDMAYYDIDLDYVHNQITSLEDKADSEFMKVIHLSILRRIIGLRFYLPDRF